MRAVEGPYSDHFVSEHHPLAAAVAALRAVGLHHGAAPCGAAGCGGTVQSGPTHRGQQCKLSARRPAPGRKAPANAAAANANANAAATANARSVQVAIVVRGAAVAVGRCMNGKENQRQRDGAGPAEGARHLLTETRMGRKNRSYYLCFTGKSPAITK